MEFQVAQYLCLKMRFLQSFFQFAKFFQQFSFLCIFQITCVVNQPYANAFKETVFNRRLAQLLESEQ